MWRTTASSVSPAALAASTSASSTARRRGSSVSAFSSGAIALADRPPACTRCPVARARPQVGPLQRAAGRRQQRLVAAAASGHCSGRNISAAKSRRGGQRRRPSGWAASDDRRRLAARGRLPVSSAARASWYQRRAFSSAVFSGRPSGDRAAPPDVRPAAADRASRPPEPDRRQLVDDVGAGRIEQQRVAVDLGGLALVVELVGADLRRLDQEPNRSLTSCTVDRRPRQQLPRLQPVPALAVDRRQRQHAGHVPLAARRGEHLDQLFLGAAHVAQAILQDRAQAMARLQAAPPPGPAAAPRSACATYRPPPSQSASPRRCAPGPSARPRASARSARPRRTHPPACRDRRSPAGACGSGSRRSDPSCAAACRDPRATPARRRGWARGSAPPRAAFAASSGSAQAALGPERDLDPQIRRLLRVFQPAGDLRGDADQLLPAAAAARDALHLLHDAARWSDPARAPPAA